MVEDEDGSGCVGLQDLLHELIGRPDKGLIGLQACFEHAFLIGGQANLSALVRGWILPEVVDDVLMSQGQQMLHDQAGSLFIVDKDARPGFVGIGVDQDCGNLIVAKDIQDIRGDDTEGETAVESGVTQKAIEAFGTSFDVQKRRTKVHLAQMHLDVIDDLEVDTARDGAKGSGIHDGNSLAAPGGQELTAPTGSIAHFSNSAKNSFAGFQFDSGDATRLPVDGLADSRLGNTKPPGDIGEGGTGNRKAFSTHKPIHLSNKPVYSNAVARNCKHKIDQKKSPSIEG